MLFWKLGANFNFIIMKKIIFRIALCVGLIFCFTQNSFAQEQTSDELKAEREALKSELKAEQTQERQKKLDELKDPGTVGTESVDKLAESSVLLLAGTKGFNETIPELYKRTIGETIDGVTDVTVQKPTLDELTNLAASIALQVTAVSETSDAVSKAAADVKALSPLKAPKALKSLNFSKDVLSLTLPELQLSAKVVNHLINTLKSADNN
ncbi:hypothetical protein EZS27_016790 [termite gut metagenome]|jgi:hypothetical protein|uniref:Uncharacterized protein n=1 Tax=termite gut metagenome TaxID=433724 RepID=A0A5J4RP86_9ZZZZ